MALTKIPRGLLDTGITDSSDATAITIDSSENVTFAGNIAHASNFTIDVGGDITLDADGGDINFHDGGTLFGQISNSSGLYLVSNVSDADIFIRGNDGGSMVNALTFDMSAAGAATFNSGVTLSGDLSISYQGGNITWGTNYPAIGNIKSSQATLLGNNIKAGSANNTIVRHAHGSDAGNFIALTYNKGVTFHTGITTTQNSDAAETTNERMRIDTTGKVQIGTSTANGHVTIDPADGVADDAYALTVRNNEATDGRNYGLWVRAGSTSADESFSVRDHANASMYFKVRGDGYVGIGETSPDNKLHITGADWNNAHIKIERTDVGGSNDAGLVFKSAAGANDATGLGGIWFQNALDSNAYALIRARTDDSSGTSGRLEFVTNTASVGNGTYAAMTIKSTGYIGIGGQSPANRLHIFGDSGDARMQFTNSNSGNAYADGLWVGIDNTQAYIIQRENQPLSMYTNGTKSWEFHEAGHFISELAGKYIQLTGSSSHAYAIGVDDNSVTPGTAGTSFSISRWNGSDWKNPFRISTAGVVQIRGLSASSEPQVSAGEILAVDGPQSYGLESRYVQGTWGPKQCSNANTYVHLVTDMWGGGSPHGNTEYIMGGFIITGFRYSTAGNLHDIIQFHNWSGSLYAYVKTELGGWTGATHAYVNSSGWVTLRLDSSGSYRNYVVDFVQYGNLYNKRTSHITAETSSNSATI